QAAVVGLDQLRLRPRPAVAGVALLPGAGDGADDARLAVDAADDGVEAGDDVKGPLPRDGGGGGLISPGRGGGPAGAAVAFLPRAGDGGDDSRLEVDLADAVVAGLGDVEGALAQVAVERLVELRFDGGSAVAGVALGAAAGHRVDGGPGGG